MTNRFQAPLFICVIRAICGFLLPSPALAETFLVHPEKPEVALGDRFMVTLRAQDPGFDPKDIIKIEFEELDPDKWHQAAPWEVIARPAEAGRTGPETDLWRSALHGFETGETPLPAARVYLRRADPRTGGSTVDEALSTTTTITIRGVRAEGDESEALRDLRPLYTFPRDWKRIWAMAGAVTLAAIALLLAWRFLRGRLRRGGPAATPAEPPLPPGVWALREIERRRRLPVCALGPAREIDSLASEVVRLYLRRRFGVDAPDMTSRECMRAMHRSGAPSDLLNGLGEFLNECDLAKFSKFEPPRERWSGIWDDAERIVRLSTPASELDPVAAPAPPETAAKEPARAR